MYHVPDELLRQLEDLIVNAQDSPMPQEELGVIADRLDELLKGSEWSQIDFRRLQACINAFAEWPVETIERAARGVQDGSLQIAIFAAPDLCVSEIVEAKDGNPSP